MLPRFSFGKYDMETRDKHNMVSQPRRRRGGGHGVIGGGLNEVGESGGDGEEGVERAGGHDLV